MFEIKNAFVGALLMLNKFTIFNIKFYADADDSDYSFGVILLPILGLLIGVASVFISIFKLIYSPLFVSILIMIYYFIITKSTNILDTYKTINLIIKPKNSNEQVFNTISIIIICLLYFVLFSVVSIRAILLMPLIGFSNLLISSLLIKRNKENTEILKYCTKNHAIFAFAFSFIITIIISYKLCIALSITLIISATIINIIDSKIKILPSSIEGFIIEMSQILFLAISYMLFI